MRYLIINSTGVIENVIVWDGEDEWAPPDGCESIQSDSEGQIGGTYIDGVFTDPVHIQPVYINP